MDADKKYKGYRIKHIGAERIVNGIGRESLVKTFMVYDAAGNGVAKAWGLTEAMALINADIRGEL